MDRSLERGLGSRFLRVKSCLFYWSSMKIAKFEQRSNEVGLCAMERCVRSFMMLSIRAFRARWVVPQLVYQKNGSVIFEAKDGAYGLVGTEEVLEGGVVE